jgi:hypothetical protein
MQAKLGFATADEKTAYCATNVEDPCCSASPEKADTAILQPANNIFIISGIVGGALAVLALGFFVFQRVSKKKQRPTTAYQVSPDRYSKATTKTKSKFFSFFSTAKPDFEDVESRESVFTTMRASEVIGTSQNLRAQLPKPSLRREPSQYAETEMAESEFAPSAVTSTRTGLLKVQVFEDYDANMDDEISCAVGDVIEVHEEFDDGMTRINNRLGSW